MVISNWLWRTRGRRPILVAAIVAAAGCGGDSAAKPPTDPAPVARRAGRGDAVPWIGVRRLRAAIHGDDVRCRRSLAVRTNGLVVELGHDKATVNSSGEVTGVAVGNVTVTATSEGQRGAMDLLVIRIAVDSVDVTPPSATMHVGDTRQLTARTLSPTGLPFPGPAATWSSSDISKATVSASGLVTATAAGSVTVTATSDGKSGRASITVTP